MKYPTSSVVAPLAACLLASAIAAQQLSVTVSPNPAPPGSSITIQAKAAFGTLYTPNGCLVTGVTQGTPTGPTVAFSFCTLVPVLIPLCTSTAAPRTYTWNQAVSGGGFAAPGDYFFHIQHSPAPFGAVTTETFGVRIQAPGAGPTLAAPVAPTWGSFFTLNIAAPANPGDLYALALAGSTNFGIPTVQGPFIWLDFDLLFQLTVPPAIPAFSTFLGALDASGAAPGLGFFIPPAPPGISCLPLHAQAAVLDASGNLFLTNGLSLTIK
jgi:hypothetical protein